MRSRTLRIGLALAIPVLTIVAYLDGAMPTKPGGLVDSDCYMHLLRAEKLWQTGRWYDSLIERSNAPYGEQLHWTRPFDVLLLGGALPAVPVVGFRPALFWWGVIVSPALLFVSLLALPWAARPLLSKDGPYVAVLFMVSQLGVLVAFQPARPDHHSLLTLLFVLSLGLTLRLILNPVRPFLCYGAAAICAFSIWVSIESILVAALVLGTLGWLWVLRNADSLSKAVRFSLALFSFLCMATLVERPWSDLMTVEFDRLSIIHCFLFGLIGLVFGTAAVLRRTRYADLLGDGRRRLAWGLGGAAMVALGLAIWSPRFFRGPFADIDPRIVAIWLSHVREVQPLVSDWCFAAPLLGATAVCLPFLVAWSVHKPTSAGWAYLGFLILVFVALSLYQIRWAAYAQVLLSLPIAQLIACRLVRPSDPGYTRRAGILNAGIIAACCYALLFAGLPVQYAVGSNSRPEAHSRTALQRICQYLVTTSGGESPRHRILTHMDLGSEILYRTPYEVIGTSYHRNARGLLDANAIMTAASFEEAQRLLCDRAIDLILIPRPPKPGPAPDPASVSTFRGRLLQGDLPCWCAPVELPGEMAASYALFEVLDRRR